MKIEWDLFNYVIMIVIVIMIAGAWAMLSIISEDNNRMLHTLTEQTSVNNQLLRVNNQLLHEIVKH